MLETELERTGNVLIVPYKSYLQLGVLRKSDYLDY